MTMTTELVELADCICGAVVDQEECPYPSGRDLEPGTGRQVYVVNCTNENCGWQCLGWGADGARKAWNTRALASRAGGWLPIESAPKDGTAVLGYWGSSLGAHRHVSGSNYGITAFCQTTGEWYDASESDNEDDVWDEPSRWQPLPEPPAAPEPVGVGSNNSTNDEER